MCGLNNLSLCVLLRAVVRSMCVYYIKSSIAISLSIVSPAGQVGVPVDDTGMQFPNIVEVASVQGEDSSDFELPPDMRN